MDTTKKPRVLSGIQPTNVLHIGNYIGAIQQWVELQKEYECFFCIVDLHAITVKYDPKVLQDNVYKLAASYLASGVDPDISTIFVQSRVSAHVELTWILNTIAKLSELERMTQFKDKAQQHVENVNVGLFDYPVLMAADILLYSPDVIPVGEDQAQHVELTCLLARRFNNQFGHVFHIPKVLLKSSGARIMALDNPSKKMSKSAKSSYNYIALDDAPSLMRKKIQKAVTDSGTDIVFDKNRAGLYNLLTLYKIFSGLNEREIEKHFSSQGYSAFKKELADLIIETFIPWQKRYTQFMKDRTQLRAIIDHGTQRANALASAKLLQVYEIMGLRLKGKATVNR